jgi:hypothetical protein
MAGHPSVKKRQKELQRKERQAEKLARRDERRTRPQSSAQDESFELIVPGEQPQEAGDPGSASVPEAPPVAPPGSGEEQRGT